MRLDGLHLLLSYQCIRECDHCFVWGSPRQHRTMTPATVREALRQSRETGTIEWIYFEGGEPFLFYAVLVEGVRAAADLGFRVGLVSNSYWAVDPESARLCLEPFRGRVHELALSADLYHSEAKYTDLVRNAVEAARAYRIPLSLLAVDSPDRPDAGGLPAGLSVSSFSLMCKGRAAVEIAPGLPTRPGEGFTECPHEELRSPERLHLDPLGNLHVCQGIVVGNIFERPLTAICEAYDPDAHPIVGPLLRSGPAELARTHATALDSRYADACHLCFETRRTLRSRYPDLLTPDAMYGIEESSASRD